MIEPGARLAGRYRLEELVNETRGAALWKATDETLARLVAVWTFTDGFPRTSEVVRAARAASRIADARVTQVFDADDSGPTAYVVEEWVSGQSLTELLSQGPLEPDRAAGLVAEAAEAVAAAASAGIHHLCLTPNKLMWSSGGAVKVTGIGVDAALRGITSADPVVTDARGVGRLLYAALTAHWPGEEQTGLRPAPLVSGRPCEPSQIRAGIPGRLNDIVCRSAFQMAGRSGPLNSAQDIADALADVPRLVPLPVTPSAPRSRPAPSDEGGPSRRAEHPRRAERGERLGVPAHQLATPPRGSRGNGRSGSSTSTVNKVLIGAVAMLVFVAVVVGAWTVGSVMNTPNEGNSQATSAEEQPANAGEPELSVLEPAGADGFDPQGDDGDEHGDKAGLAIDGDPSTSWNTQGYNSESFGNLKSGVGLIIDMGASVEIHEANLQLGGGPYSVHLRVGDAPEESALTTVSEQAGASGEVNIKLDDPAQGRYVVVWFTAPLPSDGGEYRGTVNEVELRGIT
ncbi:hypothetical protein SAMN02745673_02716 [Marinactinospora thermotolerans DSM 45154]|uniref:Protein kinase domain-containing protein n=2 Tax=Marinactinospora thermotolerans TaxID=531310 RepID=A0A1T4RDD7_9ACTN|nr:hypothetical protein SAMN02745673_02716 [Marinactinospora thermotolerans DSM 45154]